MRVCHVPSALDPANLNAAIERRNFERGLCSGGFDGSVFATLPTVRPHR